MMERRRCPKATRRSGDHQRPASSGPRWRSESRIASIGSASGNGAVESTPTIPHMSAFLLRKNAEDTADLLEAVQPAMLADGALPRAAGDRRGLVGMREKMADRLQHLVAVRVAEDLAADGEVPGQVGVEARGVGAAAA